MPRELFLLLVAIIVWLFFGVGFWLVGAAILNYSQVINVIIYGAIMGAIVGLCIGLIGLFVAFIFKSRQVIIWIISGSIIGAIVGVGAVIVVVGYPMRTQGDLSFISLGPAGLAIGGFLGTVVGIIIWKSRLS